MWLIAIQFSQTFKEPMLVLRPGLNGTKVEFVLKSGKSFLFPEKLSRKNRILDVCLLNPAGLSIVSTSFRSYLWNPVNASVRLIQDETMLLFLGYDPVTKMPARFQIRVRKNKDQTSQYYYGVWTGIVNKYKYEETGGSLADMVKRAWWPKIPYERFKLSKGEISWLLGPFFSGGLGCV